MGVEPAPGGSPLRPRSSCPSYSASFSFLDSAPSQAVLRREGDEGSGGARGNAAPRLRAPRPPHRTWGRAETAAAARGPRGRCSSCPTRRSSSSEPGRERRRRTSARWTTDVVRGTGHVRDTGGPHRPSRCPTGVTPRDLGVARAGAAGTRTGGGRRPRRSRPGPSSSCGGRRDRAGGAVGPRGRRWGTRRRGEEEEEEEDEEEGEADVEEGPGAPRPPPPPPPPPASSSLALTGR